MHSPPAPPPTNHRGTLSSRSFVALLLTQFLGAWNDNMFRWLVVPIGKDMIGAGESLALGLVCFTVPYLFFATAAGFLADRFSKRTVIVGCKFAEIVIMLLGVVAILSGNVYFLFAVVALMGSQSALFSPAKFGSLPEMLRDDKLSTGNGLMGLVTIMASALGTIAGLSLYQLTTPDLSAAITVRQIWPAAAALIGVAAAGWGISLLIARLPVANPHRPATLNPVTDSYRNIRLLAQDIPLLRTALGIAFFWMLASLAQMNIDPFGDAVLGLDPSEIGILLAVLVVGVGLGSVLAGLWSGGHVELGIVPLGATGMTISAMCVYWVGSHVDPAVAASAQHAFYWSCFWLFMLGISAGLFDIPLEAFLQHKSSTETRGTILAAANFIAFSFMLLSAGLFWLLHTKLELSPNAIFLISGLGTVPVIIYVFSLIPDATIRFIVWLFSHSVYRVRVHGRNNLPRHGGALIVPNHVTWIDGVLLLITSSRPIRMLVYADYVQTFGLRWLAKIFGVIPIKSGGGPRAIIRSLHDAREAVRNGELVCIFPEGSLTRTGQLQPFQRGVLKIVEGTDVPVIPTYLDGLWGSIFSFHGGRFFWKRPRRWPFPVQILFGTPIRQPGDIRDIRRAVEELGVLAAEKRKKREMVPARIFVRKCKSALFRPKIADSGGIELSGGRLLVGTLVFKRLLERHYLAPDEQNVGLLLPPSVGGVLANTAVTLSHRVAVNLNYTLKDEVVNYCIREAGIRHVLTSRRFLEKMPMQLDAELVFLEDLKEKATAFDKLSAMLATFLLPACCIDRLHGLTRIQPDDLLTIIFTSGSTGKPKGVMLSNHNVGSNIEAIDHVFQIKSTDVLMGLLPFFHSFGYTGTLWVTLALDPKTVYHFNPLDARTVGKLAEQHGMTILLATPTFLKHYLKRCTPEQFKLLDLAAVGAEKLPQQLNDEFHEKFGVWPTEGYGTTELSPVAAFNVPEHRAGAGVLKGTKAGTVGRVMPGAVARIVHPDTGEELANNQEGLLHIKGPNVMLGYLNQPDKTAEVLKDGWYNTGDIARIDDDGFIEITGRLSRFSKIGGEMVPHLRIEEELARIVDQGNDDEPEIRVAVTAVPDDNKGERLVVLHKPLQKPVDKILRELADTGIPNIWLPSRDSFLEVEQIPLLGTGKLDLKQAKQLALEAFTPTSDPAT